MEVIALNILPKEIIPINRVGLEVVPLNRAGVDVISLNRQAVDIIMIPVTQDQFGNVFVMEDLVTPFVSEDGANKFKPE
jgi:hypothetical protein